MHASRDRKDNLRRPQPTKSKRIRQQSLVRPAAGQPPEGFRVGIGTDLHRLERGRRLVLGGVLIPFERGPVGHSDGDALAHAICDALLGAAGLGDIGHHFPDSSPRWRNVSSLFFLHEVSRLVRSARSRIVNVDSTITLERPKLAPFIPKMRKKVAEALSLETGQVSIKAKTGEGLGALGRGEAMRADAIALIGPLLKF